MGRPRRVVSFSQLELLLQFLEQHPSLALKGPQQWSDHMEWRRLWDKVANRLNKANRDCVKTGHGWNRYWIEWKSKLRSKLARVKIGDVSRRHALTPWELRAAKLLTNKHGNLIPNRRQENIRLEINEMSTSEQNINETDQDNELGIKDTDTFQHTEKIYITNELEDTNEQNNDRDYKTQNRKDFSTSYQNTSIENGNDSIEDHNNTADDCNSDEEGEDQYHKTHPVCCIKTEYAGDHNYSSGKHEHSKLEQNDRIEGLPTNTAVESRREKSVEKLKRDMFEFQLKKQKELFEIEKRERYEKHKLDMDILRIKRDILLKELKKNVI